jgi:Tol biopolymer transport system component
VASAATSNVNLDLVMFDVERDASTRFSTGIGDDNSPVWTADGQSVIFRTNPKGPHDLAIKAAGGATPATVLLESAVNKIPSDVSRDGSTLLYEIGGVNSRFWGLPLHGNGAPFQIFPGSTDAQQSGTWSPDGKWIAYESVSPGGSNVFVQPFPPTGVREQISTTSGVDPHWMPTGRQIVFATLDRKIMAVDLTLDGGQLRAGKPVELFSRPPRGSNRFAMDPKGERFLMLVDPRADGAEPEPEPFVVIVNWPSTLKKR